MTHTELASSIGASRNRFLFLATICVGSFLLFLVQPMIARMALPRLGGAPSVWNSAMLVYQALLLGGYAYAHLLSRLPPRRQAVLHLGLFAAAALMLPIGLMGGNPPVDGNPFVWVPLLLLGSIGALFFVVSAQAPLMQRWFGLQGGGDPYPLYAASNIGSFAGLLAYPLLVEPFFSVDAQSRLWSAGYAILLLLVLACAFMLPGKAAGEAAPTKMTPRPEWSRMAQWVVLAAVPSGLMLSTTLHLTTDIVAMPLIWVIPLGIYLLSFSVAFGEGRAFANLVQRISPIFIIIAALLTFVNVTGFAYIAAALVLLCLFVLATALHARMYDLRPEPEHLTSFYLAMSLGGVVGGAFCALLAPLIFDWAYEHPILLLAAALLVPIRPLDIARKWVGDLSAIPLWTFAVLMSAAMLIALAPYVLEAEHLGVIVGAGVALGVGALFLASNRQLYIGYMIAAMMTMNGLETISQSLEPGAMTRSYFGIYTIEKRGKEATLLKHGTTLHGVQSHRPGQETAPTTYYVEESGIGLALRAAPRLFGSNARIGVVGLGAGTLACYAQPGQIWRFYEIDPVVEQIARDTRNFSFLGRCAPKSAVALGDARLVLASEPAASADLLTIDAFSSDVVPMHLLTQEALAVYGRHLTKDGLLMVHISNRFFDLSPVLAAAVNQGWTVRIRHYAPQPEEWGTHYRTASIWVAMSRSPATVAMLESQSAKGLWKPLKPKPGFRPWTDSYGSVLPLLKTMP